MNTAEIKPTSPICVRESEVESKDIGARIRSGYRSKDLGIFDAEKGIAARLHSYRPDGEFYSPRHRHTSTQVRYIVSGTMNYGKETYSAGDCTILGDGIAYGPLQPGPGPLPHFFQTVFTGAADIPNLSPEAMNRSQAELAEVGTFEKGVYRPTGGRPMDSGLAVQEHALKRTVTYPEPLTSSYLVVHTPLLRWRNYAPGVKVKDIAYLFSTGPNVKLVQLERGARLPGGIVDFQQARYVVDGTVQWKGDEFDIASMMFYPPGMEYPETRGSSNTSTLLIIQWTNVGCKPVPFDLL